MKVNGVIGWSDDGGLLSVQLNTDEVVRHLSHSSDTQGVCFATQRYLSGKIFI